MDTDKVQKEIDRIKKIAGIYKDLQYLIPGYKSEYLGVFVEMAERFDSCSLEARRFPCPVKISTE